MASTTAGPVSTTAMPDLGNGTNGVATTVDPFSQTFNNTEFFELFLQVGFFFVCYPCFMLCSSAGLVLAINEAPVGGAMVW